MFSFGRKSDRSLKQVGFQSHLLGPWGRRWEARGSGSLVPASFSKDVLFIVQLIEIGFTPGVQLNGCIQLYSQLCNPHILADELLSDFVYLVSEGDYI